MTKKMQEELTKTVLRNYQKSCFANTNKNSGRLAEGNFKYIAERISKVFTKLHIPLEIHE